MKLGIVGSGMIVNEVLSFIDEIEFDEIYLCGREKSRGKLEELAKKYSINQIFTDYDEFLKSDVDLIYIGIVNDLHFDYAKRALNAGKNVMVEKPAAISAAQVKELCALAREKAVFFFEALSIYYMPAFLQLQKDVNLVGNVRIVNFNYSQRSSRYDRFVEGDIVPVFDPKHYGGALRDLNIYNISTMVGLFGKPDHVSYSPNMINGIDVSGVLTADYGEFTCVCIGAKDCNAPGPSTIQGDAATICIYPVVNGMTEYDVLFNDADTETKEVDMGDGSHRLYYEFDSIKKMIENGDKDSCYKHMIDTITVAEIIDEALA